MVLLSYPMGALASKPRYSVEDGFLKSLIQGKLEYIREEILTEEDQYIGTVNIHALCIALERLIEYYAGGPVDEAHHTIYSTFVRSSLGDLDKAFSEE